MSGIEISSPQITLHAWRRMGMRKISFEAVCKIIDFGRICHTRGAMIYAVGNKEISKFKKEGIDLSDVAGGHVVCCPTGEILTVYRNQCLSKLRH